MKALVQTRYGPPDLLELRDVDVPRVGEDDALVRVEAAAVNPLDEHDVRGEPYFLRLGRGLRRPKTRVPGVDLAGRVEAVGGRVTALRPGDEVFGLARGTLAEYASGKAELLVPKPQGLTFEEAAAVPVAALTALQALRDQGRLQGGQTVLIVGASGGVGTFAVQIARSFGAEVTGVCSTGNVNLVRSLGADHVVDYTREDYTRSGRQYDLIVDMAGTHPLSECRRALTRRGTYVVVGAPSGRWLSGPDRFVGALVMSPFVSQRIVPFVTSAKRPDLLVLKDLLEAGSVKTVVDRTWPLTDAAEAIRCVEGGHARGKIVVRVPLPGS